MHKNRPNIHDTKPHDSKESAEGNSFQMHLNNVVRTGCFCYSCGLGQLDSKSLGIFSALCSGERVGTSSIVRGDL